MRVRPASRTFADRLQDPACGKNWARLAGGRDKGDHVATSSEVDTGVTAAADGTIGGGVADAVWDGVLAHLRRTLSDGPVATWFSGVRALEIGEDAVLLQVPHPFARDWIESRYLDLLRAAVLDVTGRPLDVNFVAGDAPDEELAPIEEVPAAAPPPDEPAAIADFHPRYNFDSFVIGSSNRFAHAAALAVAEAPAQAYNPLFIYGGAGLGKTHLLHAIGHYVNLYHPGLTVRYVTTEQFVNDFILAVQRRTFPHFHARYRVADILLVDDVQFLEGKERIQEEFFHTFNALHPSSQIILTSDRPPKKISTLEERLRTRFEWGLITDIQPPDLETRLAILRKKAETEDLHTPPDVLDFIASRIQTNIRELEGALIRVAAYASLTRTPISLQLAQDVLQSLLPHTHEAQVTADLIISVAAEYFDLTPQDIKSANRSRPLVNARQIAMYLCRELTDLSLPEIGKRFGGRDHSTVIHATTKIRKQLPERTVCYEQVQELTARVRQQAARG
jgi:chromosomal replication initiator protein